MSEAWKAPNEEEFNHEWMKPNTAVQLIAPAYGGETTAQRWLMSRLKSGVIQAVARTVHHPTTRLEFKSVPARLWEQFDEWGEDHFWLTGDQIFHDRGATLRMLDIRFDPESIGSRAKKPAPPEASIAPTAAGPDERPPLSKSDAERFCRAVLAGWPDLTQDWAYEKAVLFFHDKKVARDRFRSILRSIRGEVKRGKKPQILD